MNPYLDDDLVTLGEHARRFASGRVAPGFLERDRTRELERGLMREMGEMGFIAPELPEAFGGQGLGCLAAGVIHEEIARADLSISYINLLASLNGQILSHHGKAEVVRPWLERLTRGEALLAIALTEPRGGSDAASLRLRIEKTDDAYVLNGEKTSISMADQCDQIVVFARTGPQEARARAITAFVVPMDAAGVTVTRFDDVGSSAVGRGSVFFADVRVAEERMVGEENQAFRTVMTGFDYSRALIGLQCLAPAIASLEETWAYAGEREAFGAPIVRNQGVSEPLAEAETMIEAAKLLCYKTLWLRDQDLPHTAEAAMSKWWPPQVAFDVIHRCLLTHGHLGYAKDLPFQQRMRDVLGLHIGDGTRQIQKLIIARQKAGRGALAQG
jgi:cyclohexanecarboxyl-CoA dehydrogenase